MCINSEFAVIVISLIVEQFHEADWLGLIVFASHQSTHCPAVIH